MVKEDPNGDPDQPPARSATRSALLITTAYAAWAIFWILVSDPLLAILSDNGQLSPAMQWWKSFTLVVVTAVLLFLLIYRHSRQLIAANRLIAGHLAALTRDMAERKRAELALKNSQQEVKARANQQAVVSELGLYALSGRPLEALFETAASKVAETLHLPFALILQPLSEGGMQACAGFGWSDGVVGERVLDAGRHDSHVGHVSRLDKPVTIADHSAEEGFGLEPLLGDYGIVSSVSTTLRGGSGQYGVLAAYSNVARAFGAADVNFIQGVANVLATAIERRRDEAQLAYLAQHDVLTDLPNRALLEDRLAVALVQARRNGMRVALMHLDIDQFKLFNDSAGHQVGDALLKFAAGRLVACLRAGDTVSRQGGDEFTMIFPDLESIEAAALIAQKLLDAMRQPFIIEDHEVFLTASIGISLYPDDAAVGGELIRHADAAMYRAKQKGRNAFHFSTPDINAGIEERLKIESGMRNAMARNELRMVYQPQIDLKTGKVSGVEALLRWTSATLGVVSPERFIPIAEETGAIIPIGEWALRAACRQARIWHDAGHQGLRVVVNLSARQFGSARMVEMVSEVAHEAQCPPSSLELEITESDVMRDPAGTIEMIKQLKHLGVSISIDDFGTGYSSLSYLKRFDADVLKIDKSFVRDIAMGGDDAVIATSIIGLAHNLGMTVVAEGVEQHDQLAFLAQSGCDLVQGYLLSYPLEADQVSVFVNRFSLQEFQALRTAA